MSNRDINQSGREILLVSIFQVQRICNFHFTTWRRLDLERFAYELSSAPISRIDIERWMCSFSVDTLLIAAVICVCTSMRVYVYMHLLCVTWRCVSKWTAMRFPHVSLSIDTYSLPLPDINNDILARSALFSHHPAHFISRSISQSVDRAKQLCRTQFWWHRILRNNIDTYSQKYIEYIGFIMRYAVSVNNKRFKSKSIV